MVAERKNPSIDKEYGPVRVNMQKLKEIEKVFADYADATTGAHAPRRLKIETPTHKLDTVNDIVELEKATIPDLTIVSGSPSLRLWINPYYASLYFSSLEVTSTARDAAAQLDSIVDETKISKVSVVIRSRLFPVFAVLLAIQLTYGLTSARVFDIDITDWQFYLQFAIIPLGGLLSRKSKPYDPIIVSGSERYVTRRFGPEIGYLIAVAAVVVTLTVGLLNYFG